MQNTKHTCEAEERAFGRRVAGCPRCAELANGAAPRAGWQQGYFARKAEQERIFKADLAGHYSANGCKCGGPVCTRFDW